MTSPVLSELMSLGKKSRVFVSMPYIEGLTPRIFNEKGRYEVFPTDEPVERRHGIFHLDEVGISPLDHGALYGDGCFEGILIVNGQTFLFREHMLRWGESARLLDIKMPYPLAELAKWIVKTIREAGFGPNEKGYLRPVLTRGFGNLGINPAKCIAPTLFVIVSTIQLYPDSAYESGIELSVSRHIRRAQQDIINPNIKSCNYLNNIFGLLENKAKGRLETILLSRKGYVTEATADNIFCIEKLPGWENNPQKVTVHTPVKEYCLIGLTRNLVLREAVAIGYQVKERYDLMPIDFIGPEVETFMTGTGCGIMPVIGLEGHQVGDGKPGAVTKKLLERVRNAMTDPSQGLSNMATPEEIAKYMEGRPVVPINE